MQGARPGRLPPLAGGARTPGAVAVSLRDRAEAEAYVKEALHQRSDARAH